MCGKENANNVKDKDINVITSIDVLYLLLSLFTLK